MPSPAFEAPHGQRTSLASYLAIALVTLAGLVGARIVYGYLLFHSLVEIFAVAVAAGTFMIVWNLRRYFDTGYLIVLSIAFFFAACVDTLHTFAYRGMNVFPEADTDLPTQLWLIARYIQAGGLLVAPAFVRRKVSPAAVFWSFATVTAALLASLLAFGVFPSAFVEGVGLTPFKIWSEYAISTAMALGLAAVWYHRDAFPREVLWLLSGSIVMAIASELAFTLYTDPYAIWNFVGHVFKVVAFFLLYRAVAETVLVRPFDVLFEDLQRTTEQLRESELRFRSTFEQATLGIAHVDLQGRWLRFNRRLADITGYTSDELEDLKQEDVTHPDDQPRELELVQRLVSGEIGEYRLEKRYLRKNGSVTWVEAGRTLFRSADGTPRYFIEVVEDITSRRLQEEELRRSRDLTEAVNAIDFAMNSTPHIAEMTRIAADEGCRAIGAESAAMFMREGDRWWLIHLHDPLSAAASDDPLLSSSVPLAEADGSPLVIDDVSPDEPENLEVMQALYIRSLITVPLRFRGEDLGVIYFNYHSRRHSFSDAEIEFCRKLSSSATLAVENARLSEAQRVVADTLQSALLHMPESMPGLDFAHAYRSATELARIGGDFYDMFDVSPEVVAFVLGDVSGKGLEAATLTAMAKSTIRAFAYQDHRPGHVLAAANAAITSQIDESRFITAVYGTIHVERGILRMACAGHPMPLLCIDGKCVGELFESSPPLGVVPDATFDEFETTLDHDSLLVTFSDGLIEARNEASFLGEGRVTEIIESKTPQGPQVVVDTLLAEADMHSSRRGADDIAVIALRYVGPTEAVDEAVRDRPLGEEDPG